MTRTPKFISRSLYLTCLQRRVPSLAHSFTHTCIPSLALAPSRWPPAMLGFGAKMNRTQQCLGEGDSVQALGLQAYFRSSPGPGCVGQGCAPFLSQMRTVESLTMMEDWQLSAQRAARPERRRGCSLPPARSAICSPQWDTLILSCYLRAKEVGTSEVTLALHNSAPKK